MRRIQVRSVLVLALLTLVATGYGQESADAVTEDTRRVFDAYSEAHDPSHYAEDATFTVMSVPEQEIVGRDAVAGFLATFYGGAFTNAHGAEVEKLIEGNHVMLEFVFSGDHTGDLFGIPATGKHVEVPMMSVYHIEDGLIRWARLYYDTASLMRQLGVVE